MSLFDDATTGIIETAKISLIYGPNKVGKTSFVCAFPKHFLFDIEKGSDNVPNAKRYQKIATFADFQSALTAFCLDPQGHKVLGIDSVEALESLILTHLCEEGNVKSIEEYGGGFGKGIVRSREIMSGIMKQLQKLTRDHGVEVFLIGHSQQKSSTDPMTNTQYDKFTLRTNEKMASVIRDLADNIFFCCRKLMTTKKDGKEIAVSDNDSYLYTSWRLAFDAGNRINLPFEIPLSYTAYMKAKESARPVSVDDLKGECVEMAKGLDKETHLKVVESLKKAKSVDEVAAIKTRIQQIVAA